ncbi:MAG: amidohydrolase [Rubricoccaceae bacterium]|nr:amidohydrolase [Rubricoccaceae bacterium]
MTRLPLADPATTESIVAFRKRLHAHPELSGQEHETAQAVRTKLEDLKPDELIAIGSTGLAAVFSGEESGPTVLLRSELDALPIQEVNDFEHRSNVRGVSHKCGHDGHTAILTGVAQKIASNRITSGRLVLLFQPAEETGEGAKRVLADPAFEGIRPDYVFALHNLPGCPAGVVVVKDGVFTAAVCTLILTFSGRTAHAAEPEHGRNPVYAISEIVRLTREMEQTDVASDAFTLITPVYLSVGDIAYGTAPGEGELHLTIRAWSNINLDRAVGDVIRAAERLALEQGLEIDSERVAEFSANVNDEEATRLIREAAKATGVTVQERLTPFKWGEDFGLFTERYRGAMFGIGAGVSHPALHNPDYDFPDEIIPGAVDLFERIARQLLA